MNIKSEYKNIDIFEIIRPLANGETIELKDIYIGCLYSLDLAKISYSKNKWKLQYLFNKFIPLFIYFHI
jgi:hypothetical protein